MKEETNIIIRDRIKEFRRVPANELVPNAKNWRKHPERQRELLEGVLVEIGYAGALLAREHEDGTLELIDGHLRAETTPNQQVPVLVLDLDEKEAATLLALYDPLSSIAEKDNDILGELIKDIELSDANLRIFLDELLHVEENLLPSELAETKEVAIPETLFQLLIESETEEEQRILFEEFQQRRLNVKILNMQQ